MGWSLAAKIFGKKLSGLGDDVSGALASFDPETATEVDRENLASKLQQVASKLAGARRDYDKEHKDVLELTALIESDSKALDVLAQRLEAGTITEDVINTFCDQLEANKTKLEVEVEEENVAKEYMDELQSLVDALSNQLSEFDTTAKKIKQDLKIAETRNDLETMKSERSTELAHLHEIKGSATALQALSKKAAKLQNQADGKKLVNDITKKEEDKATAIDDIRKSVSQPVAESALDRIKRLSTSK